MGKYSIDENGWRKAGETYLLSGMTLKVIKDGVEIVGLCNFGRDDKLHVYPRSGEAISVDIGDEVEVLSQERDQSELYSRQQAIAFHQLSWQERAEINVELTGRTGGIDSSNEGW